MVWLNYGKGKIELNLPVNLHWQELRMANIPPVGDPVAAIEQAIAQPVGLPPLRELVRPGEKMCLIVNDSTRVARSELFLPCLLNELNQAGIMDKDIFIVFANGTHRPLNKNEMVDLVGPEVAIRVNMFNHDCDNEEELIHIGVTTRGNKVSINKKVAMADRRILTGSVTYHYFAGFSGGRKALVPGVAGRGTIVKNHSFMLDKNARSGVLEGNPVHEDLLEAAQMVGEVYILNVVLNEHKELIGVYSGHLEKAHKKCCKMVEQAYGITVDKPADLLVVSSGGYPKDINFYQAQKALENAIQVLKPGGQLILLAQCPEGVGSDMFQDWMHRYHTLNEIQKAIEADFQIGGHKAYTVAKAVNKGDIYLVSQILPEIINSFGFRSALSLDEALQKVIPNLRDGAVIYVIPDSSLTVPVIKLSE